MDFKTIKRNYDKGLWSKVAVKIAVVKGLITAEQYAEITGDVYAA